MNTAIIKKATGKESFKIELELKPFPTNYGSSKEAHFFNGALTVLICSLAFSMIPASFIVLTVRERDEKIKH